MASHYYTQFSQKKVSAKGSRPAEKAGVTPSQTIPGEQAVYKGKHKAGSGFNRTMNSPVLKAYVGGQL